MAKVQVCSHCGNARKGHPMPFGKNCKQKPLTQQQKDELLQNVNREDIEIISDDTNPPGSAEELRAELERMRLEKEKLKQQTEKTDEEVKKAEEVELLKQWTKMKEEMNAMLGVLEDKQAQLVNIQTRVQELDKEVPVTNGAPPTVPATVQPPVPGVTTTLDPVSRQAYPAHPGPSPGVAAPQTPVFKVPTAPAPRTPSAHVSLDPSLHVYAGALAAQSPVASSHTAANVADQAAGWDPAKIFAENPQLAAACGITGASTSSAQGKCLAEHYIYKSHSREKERPSYYDFIHGALRMMKTRLIKNHLPIDDFLVYYEYIACLATQYRWHAVYDVHCGHVADIDDKLKTWANPVDQHLKEKFCNAAAALPDKETRPARRDVPRGVGRRDGSSRDRDSDRDVFRGQRSLSASSASSGYRPTCDLFNREPFSCTFTPCKYRHECSDCEKRGIKASHSRAYCEGLYPIRGQGYGGQAGQNNGQAGAGGAH